MFPRQENVLGLLEQVIRIMNSVEVWEPGASPSLFL